MTSVVRIALLLLLAMPCAFMSMGAQAEPADGENRLIAVNLEIDGELFPAMFYDNASARALIGRMPLTLDMDDYAAQEKVARLPFELPDAATEQPRDHSRGRDLSVVGRRAGAVLHDVR